MSIDADSAELYKWIDEHQISRQKKNLNRDFSDAVPLAEILKKHFPKIVELHNYSPKNSLVQKMHNWEIMNRKILNKLKINLSRGEMEDLAKATPGAIEKLLHKVKLKVKAKCSGGNKDGTCEESFYLEIANDESNNEYIAHSELNIPDVVEKNDPPKSTEKPTERPTEKTIAKVVPPKKIEHVSPQEYERLKMEVLDKDDTITDLKSEIDQLRTILLSKDIKIKDLTQQLNKLVNPPSEDPRGTPRPSFFNKLF